MTPIPKDDQTALQRMIGEHETCMASMEGVAGCAVLRCQQPGDVTVVSGGIAEDRQLARVLIRMRAQTVVNKLVVICTRLEKEWRIARLSGIRGVAPSFIDERIFNDEQSVQHAVFLLRLQEMKQFDGMPADFNEGWKRRIDSWA